jgi:sugar phosphate isomerase/epimerase
MAAVGSAGALWDAAAIGTPANPGFRFKIAGFSKPFQNLNFDDTADVVAQVGWDGIECPLRKGGHVLPERVEEDLPKMVEALQRRHLEIVSIATDVRDASDPLTERVLRTAAKLGIKRYRLAFFHYDLSRPIPAQLDAIRAGLKDLLALNQELGLCAAIENHSGKDAVGAPVWDIYELIKDFDPRRYGVCFDIGHATIEGGYDWRIQFRLIEPYLIAVYVKDFTWKRERGRWIAQWGPLGQGMIDPSFFGMLAKSSFFGPIVQHIEFPVGRGRPMIDLMKRERETLRKWLIEEGA